MRIWKTLLPVLVLLPKDAHGQGDSAALIHTHKKACHVIVGPISFSVSEIVERQPLSSG